MADCGWECQIRAIFFLVPENIAKFLVTNPDGLNADLTAVRFNNLWDSILTDDSDQLRCCVFVWNAKIEKERNLKKRTQ